MSLGIAHRWQGLLCVVFLHRWWVCAWGKDSFTVRVHFCLQTKLGMALYNRNPNTEFNKNWNSFISLFIYYFTYLFIHFVIRRNWKVGDSRLAQGLNCILAEDPWIFWTVPSCLLHLQSSCQHFRQIEGESTGASWFSFKRFLDKFHLNSSAHILLGRIQWFPSSKGSEDSWTVVDFLFLLLFVLGRVFVYIYIWIVFLKLSILTYNI